MFGAQSVFGRMADGANQQSVRAEMETIARRLASDYPRTNQNVVPVVENFNEFFIGNKATTIWKALWGAVGFVLLIACANLANLLLARAAGRSREISVRLALGSGRWRIVRHSLIESLVLSGVGGLAGWWIAKWSVRIYALAADGKFAAIASTGNVLDYSMDSRHAAYLIAISIVTGILFGLAPALRLANLDINAALKDGGRGATRGFRGKHLSRLLVIGQMALALILLTGAGVMIRSFLKVFTANMGIDARNVLRMDLYAPPERFASAEERLSFYRDIGARLQALPGVESVGFGGVPTYSVPRIGYELADVPIAEEHSRPTVAEIIASADYFRTLGVSVIAGRAFNDFDGASSPAVAIVNQQFANRNWPGEVPLGKRLRLYAPGKTSAPWVTVVGVVSNIVQNDPTRQTFEPLVYLPDGQEGGADQAFIRTRVAPGNLSDAVRRQVYAIAPDLPAPVWPLEELLDRGLAFEQRNISALFLIFAAIALLLASIGLYTVIAHSVSQRTQEIGVRIAIGGTPRDILKLVFRQGMLPLAIGLTVGLAASFAVNRLLQSMLVQVSPADPITLAVASAVLILAGTLGCLIPARRAMRVDPVVALRHD